MQNEDLNKLAAAFQQVATLEEAKKKKLDKVDKDELDGDHDDRDDKDIDNDGDVDSSDEYLHKKRKAISKNEAKESTCEECGCDLDDPKEDCDCSHDNKNVDEAKRRNGRTGAPKMTGALDAEKAQREKDRAHNDAMGRTRTGRKKPVRTGTSTKKSLASLRKEGVEAEAELDENMKLINRIKNSGVVKSGSMSKDNEADRKKAIKVAKDVKAGKYKGVKFANEEVEVLDENKAIIKIYQDMKAQGKKDHNILDYIGSMPKYKRISRDQMAKIIGDAKRKGIFREEVEQIEELTAAEKKLINQMYDKKGNLTPLGKKVFAAGQKNEEVELEERDYKKEYANYQGKKEQIAKRSSRNAARRLMAKKTDVAGKDVGHKDNNPLNNDPKNLRVEDPSENRREPRLRNEEVELDEASVISRKPHPEGGHIVKLKTSSGKTITRHLKNGKVKDMKENDEVEVNPKKKTKRGDEAAEVTAESTKWAVFERILEKRAQSKAPAKADGLKDDDTLSGKGAKDMDKDLAVDKTSMGNKEKESHDSVGKAERAGPATKTRNGDNKAGDTKIVNPVKGTK